MLGEISQFVKNTQRSTALPRIASFNDAICITIHNIWLGNKKNPSDFQVWIIICWLCKEIYLITLFKNDIEYLTLADGGRYFEKALLLMHSFRIDCVYYGRSSARRQEGRGREGGGKLCLSQLDEQEDNKMTGNDRREREEGGSNDVTFETRNIHIQHINTPKIISLSARNSYMHFLMAINSTPMLHS